MHSDRFKKHFPSIAQQGRNVHQHNNWTHRSCMFSSMIRNLDGSQTLINIEVTTSPTVLYLNLLIMRWNVEYLSIVGKNHSIESYSFWYDSKFLVIGMDFLTYCLAWNLLMTPTIKRVVESIFPISLSFL